MSTKALPSSESNTTAPTAGPSIGDPAAIAKLADMIAYEGYTYQYVYQVSAKQMEAMYAYGYDLQKRGQYEKAERIFHYLCFLNHYEESYWIALGFCRERQRNYQNAIAAYYVAGTLVPDDAIPPLRSAECLMLLGQLEGAQKAAQLAVQNAGDDPAREKRKARAEFLLKVIQKRLSGGCKR